MFFHNLWKNLVEKPEKAKKKFVYKFLSRMTNLIFLSGEERVRGRHRQRR